MTVTIQLSVAGANTTVFNLFSNIDYGTPLATGITKAQLLAGYSVLNVPNNATIIRVVSTGTCGTQVDLNINQLPPLTYSCEDDEIVIGTQTWSTCNLNTAQYRDGTAIPQHLGTQEEWNNLTTGAWCYYHNVRENGVIYGKLYNWYAVQGLHDNNSSTPLKYIAPVGWRVPTINDFQTLSDSLGGNSIAGNKLKSTGTSLWTSATTPNGSTNISGFTALPGGWRWGRDYGFNDIGGSQFSEGNFWCSGESRDHISLAANNDDFEIFNGREGSFGYSVRLIKNQYSVSLVSSGTQGTAQQACDGFENGTLPTLNYYMNDDWFEATRLCTNLAMTTLAPAGMYSEGSYSKYWNGSVFTGAPITCLPINTVQFIGDSVRDFSPAPAVDDVCEYPGQVINHSGTMIIVGNPVTITVLGYFGTQYTNYTGNLTHTVSFTNSLGVTSSVTLNVTTYVYPQFTELILPAGTYSWTAVVTFMGNACPGGGSGITWAQAI